jgi:hypothetical protein
VIVVHDLEVFGLAITPPINVIRLSNKKEGVSRRFPRMSRGCDLGFVTLPKSFCAIVSADFFIDANLKKFRICSVLVSGIRG